MGGFGFAQPDSLGSFSLGCFCVTLSGVEGWFVEKGFDFAQPDIFFWRVSRFFLCHPERSRRLVY
ncbi:hypothetical protein AB674_15475 [Flavobacterium sp. ABG]|nr:hypothetical protein AB674_15475 [Flavobacterium sp. ABG]